MQLEGCNGKNKCNIEAIGQSRLPSTASAVREKLPELKNIFREPLGSPKDGHMTTCCLASEFLLEEASCVHELRQELLNSAVPAL